MSRTYTKDELQSIIEQHGRWLRGVTGGVRADLRGANLSDANLSDANLSGAHLSDANLSGAHLRGANLSRANLSRANLFGADLSGAHLSGANLSRANLSRANLFGADLSGANLRRANLFGANLFGADLIDANLSGANLSRAKDDIRAILDVVPNEVDGLLKALREGRIDGSVYEGACACLVGTIANIRGCNYQQVANLAPDSNRPAERIFLAIREGDTPSNHPIAKLVEEWIVEWQRENVEVKP